MGSEWSGPRVGIGGDGVWAGLGAGVIDATLVSPSRESSLSRTMPSAGEAMVEDGRDRVQAYRPERAVTPGALARSALWPENGYPAKKEFTSSRASRGRKNVVGSRGFLVDMRNRPPNRRSSDGPRLAEGKSDLDL